MGERRGTVTMKTTLFNGNTLVSKPWGQYVDIYRSASVVFKLIDIKSGEGISYQYHNLRDELWYISAGMGTLTLNDEELMAHSGDNFYIKKRVAHQIINTGKFTLSLFEMQCGNCSEDDIVRISDKYER